MRIHPTIFVALCLVHTASALTTEDAASFSMPKGSIRKLRRGGVLGGKRRILQEPCKKQDGKVDSDIFGGLFGGGNDDDDDDNGGDGKGKGKGGKGGKGKGERQRHRRADSDSEKAEKADEESKSSKKHKKVKAANVAADESAGRGQSHRLKADKVEVSVECPEDADFVEQSGPAASPTSLPSTADSEAPAVAEEASVPSAAPEAQDVAGDSVTVSIPPTAAPIITPSPVVSTLNPITPGPVVSTLNPIAPTPAPFAFVPFPWPTPAPFMFVPVPWPAPVTPPPVPTPVMFAPFPQPTTTEAPDEIVQGDFNTAPTPIMFAPFPQPIIPPASEAPRPTPIMFAPFPQPTSSSITAAPDSTVQGDANIDEVVVPLVPDLVTSNPSISPTSPQGCSDAFVYCPGRSTCLNNNYGWSIDLRTDLGLTILADCEIWTGVQGCDMETGTKVGSATVSRDLFHYCLDVGQYESNSFHLYAGRCVANDAGAQVSIGGFCREDLMQSHLGDFPSFTFVHEGGPAIDIFTFDASHPINTNYWFGAEGFPIGTELTEFVVAHVEACPVGVLERDPLFVQQASLPPTRNPTLSPTDLPTASPSLIPTKRPNAHPSSEPSVGPSSVPTSRPTTKPMSSPTIAPTVVPTSSPTTIPTSKPTVDPTSIPTTIPTNEPTASPTTSPIALPTIEPTMAPTESPTIHPTIEPTVAPTTSPTNQPTWAPTIEPTRYPTITPSRQPSPSGRMLR